MAGRFDMLRLQELDELDRQVEEDAKAQRREYTRRQEGVKPQGWLVSRMSEPLAH